MSLTVKALAGLGEVRKVARNTASRREVMRQETETADMDRDERRAERRERDQALMDAFLTRLERRDVEIPEDKNQAHLFKLVVAEAVRAVGRGNGPWVRIPVIAKLAEMDGKDVFETLRSEMKDYVAVSVRYFPATVAPIGAIPVLEGRASTGGRKDARTSAIMRQLDTLFDKTGTE